MLLKSKTTVKLQKRYLKILFLSTALKDTFALVVMPSIGKEAVLHCDTHGKVLFEKTFSHPVVHSLGQEDPRPQGDRPPHQRGFR